MVGGDRRRGRSCVLDITGVNERSRVTVERLLGGPEPLGGPLSRARAPACVFKARKQHDLWQLAGYALADTDDTYEVRDVGISAMRWRRRWIIGLDELVLRLAGRPVDIAHLRGELAAVPASATPSRSRPDRPHMPPPTA
jgi:hypothetical protein